MNQPANDPNSPAFIEQVAKMAMLLGQNHLVDYGSARSRHDFTQRQLLTCLVLRIYLKTTYRGVLDMLRANRTLRRCLELTDKLPHFTTLQKFSARSQVVVVVQQLIAAIDQAMAMQEATPAAPVAGTPPEWLAARPANASTIGRDVGATNR